MIAQLTGTLAVKSGMDVVIDCGGVGYAVSVPLSTAERLPAVGERATVLTILAVREDAMQLFGFLTGGERDAFTLITNISGIGGRTALGILSAMSLADLRSAILRNDLVALQRLPGVGKKTAERLVVELRDKVVTLAADTGTGDTTLPPSQHAEEALAALQSLGFSRTAAEKAIKAVLSADPASASASSETLIRLALRHVG